MEFSKIVKVFMQLEQTSKRLEKTAILKTFLQNIDSYEKPLLLLQGLVFPVWNTTKLGFSKKSISKALSSISGISEEDIQKQLNEKGDIGLVAKLSITTKPQMSLGSFETKQTLSLDAVFDTLQQLANEEGHSSISRKMSLLKSLLANANGDEAKYICRLAAGELRIGISTGTIRDAIRDELLPEIMNLTQPDEKHESEISFEQVKNDVTSKQIVLQSYEDARKLQKYYTDALQLAIDKRNDLGEIAQIAKEKGIQGITQVSIKPLIPFRVMLMQKITSVANGLSQIKPPLALEYKYDGFRGILHKKGDTIKIFTRSLEEVSAQFPDVVAMAKKNITATEAIIDGEIIGLSKEGTYIPFQHISQRIKRKHNIEEMAKKVPVCYTTWDIMYLEGREVLQETMQKRRELLQEIITESATFHLSKQELISSEEEGNLFYEKSLKEGNEGVVLKDLQGTYQPGNRVGCWLKLKPIMDPLDTVILGAEWGEGKRASWLTSFIIAIKKDDELLEIGKVGTGFKELDSEEGISFSKMTELLKPLIISEDKHIVKVEPKIIITVQYEEIQKSSSYKSGFALRFPRVESLREDLDVHEIDDLEKVRQYYDSQLSL